MTVDKSIHQREQNDCQQLMTMVIGVSNIHHKLKQRFLPVCKAKHVIVLLWSKNISFGV